MRGHEAFLDLSSISNKLARDALLTLPTSSNQSRPLPYSLHPVAHLKKGAETMRRVKDARSAPLHRKVPKHSLLIRSSAGFQTETTQISETIILSHHFIAHPQEGIHASRMGIQAPGGA